MNPEEIEKIVERALSGGLQFPYWLYLLVIIASLIGAFLGAYFKKKGENLATKEDYESLLDQIKQTTIATENIKIDLAKGNWLHQQGWYLKEKYYSALLEALYKLKLSLSARLDRYMEQGSEYLDEQINESVHFKDQTKIGFEALEQIQQIHGPAEMAVSLRASEALNKFYDADWHANNFSVCNKEYLDEVYASVDEAYKVVLEEARLELR